MNNFDGQLSKILITVILYTPEGLLLYKENKIQTNPFTNDIEYIL